MSNDFGANGEIDHPNTLRDRTNPDAANMNEKGADHMAALKWINTGAFAAMVAVNALANLLPIGGNTTGRVSEAYPNLFTPAPITFAIWGVIYLLMAVFIVYQWEVFDGGLHSAKLREDVGLWFTVSCALNIGWIFLWHYGMIGYSTICITLLLAVLMIIRGQLTAAGGNLLQRMAATSGFSIYFGWIIVATLANIFVWQTKIGWNGWGLPADFWTVTALLIGAVIAAAVVLIGGDRIAGIAVMWAVAGILIRHISPAYYGGAHPFVIAAGFLSDAVILTAILLPSIVQFAERMKFVSAR